MATLNLGRIKPVFRGAYNSSTSYVVDDIVTSGGSTFICILASTGNATSNSTYWSLLAEGGDVASTLTTQGDILYRDASGLQRLGAGTSGQYLETRGSGANPVWSTVSSGNFSVHAFDKYTMGNTTGHSGQTDYVDIANGNYVSFTPTSTSDVIYFFHGCVLNWGGQQGADVYLNRGTSTTLGSSDTKLNYSGTHANYTNSLSDYYAVVTKAFQMPCTGLTVGTTYYVEQVGAVHTNNSTVNFNTIGSNGTGEQNRHWVSLIHYKSNS